MSVIIDKITLERYASPFAVQHTTPRLSWRFGGNAKDWTQERYELVLERRTGRENYEVKSSESVFVPWPSSPLNPRERLTISVKAHGSNGVSTAWSSIDAEYALDPTDWVAGVSLGPLQDANQPKRPFKLRKRFTSPHPSDARLYITALGVYEVYINGFRAGDHVLAPGWQSYNHRLHYQTFDVSPLLQSGENTIEAWIGEGWYAGRLGWGEGKRNIYGDEIGLMAQLEVAGQVVLHTGTEGWAWAFGEVVSSEIYDGEHVRFTADTPSWSPARNAPLPATEFLCPEGPPVRRKEVVRPVERIITATGKVVFDFGQNVVGWARLKHLPAKTTITLRHAEVLEHGELGVRPLRAAKCTDVVETGREENPSWEPKFTFHGFRYCEVSGWDANVDNIEAVVIYSDMERLGDFECSHRWMTKFHENTMWGLKGNFVSVPTDCPQRDERLGWTGDLQAFCSTASFLYDTSGLLGDWLSDLRFEQKEYGLPPLVVPNVLGQPKRHFAIWSDVTALAPLDLFDAYGDHRVLADQWDSMVDWLEQGVIRDESTGLWFAANQQLGDWLDPTAPEDVPDDTHSDSILVANAYLIHTTRAVARIARILGRPEVDKYEHDAQRLAMAFRDEYTSPKGMIMSDTQATLALALRFELFDTDEQRKRAAERLSYHVRRRAFKIQTGFAGTPVILPALTSHGYLQTAYRMFQEKQCPSLLYPISMGATTVWERWNSILPDGTINPGEMTSFNHYALGAVSRWLYETVAGLSCLEPGWKSALIRPQPGGTVTWAKASHLSPYGRYAVQWEIKGDELHMQIEVPPNTTARVILGGTSETVESGSRTYSVPWRKDDSWPVRVLQPPPLRPQLIDEVVE